MNKDIFINISQLSTGFIEIPGSISLNIYVQGCEKRCPGCQNPELQSFSGGQKLFLKDVNEMLSDFPMSKWICWLGGDAVYQPDSLREFNKVFKEKGLRVCLYTGKQFNQLLDLNILDNIDMVIDGEWYGKSVQDSDTNQQIYLKDGGIWYHLTWNDLDSVLNKGVQLC